MQHEEYYRLTDKLKQMPIGTIIKLRRSDKPVMYTAKMMQIFYSTIHFKIIACPMEKHMVGITFGFSDSPTGHEWIEYVTIGGQPSIKQFLKEVRGCHDGQ